MTDEDRSPSDFRSESVGVSTPRIYRRLLRSGKCAETNANAGRGRGRAGFRGRVFREARLLASVYPSALRLSKIVKLVARWR